jgi:N-acetyl-1-D-myo-inositol-2-amino-2-deoxy-alpha-D-glucopyranoside deacetylase
LDGDLRDAITRVKPDVVVTFDVDGLYWHPDHIVMHERTTAVVAAMGEEAPALFYVSMPRGSMRGVLTAAAAAADPDAPMPQRVLGIEEVDAFGLFAAPPSLVVDAAEFAAAKLAALRCHRSQIAGDGLDLLPVDQAARLLGVEHYRRAAVGAQGEAFIERLGSRVGS